MQAWYNQDLAVDPANPDHVYAGLEEVFESTNAGGSWVTASPYWNYPLACDATNTCPNTTHPDQHAMMITDGKIVIGNDGGVYSRPLSDDPAVRRLDRPQRHAARPAVLRRPGRQPGRGTTAVVGGLQDNGTAVGPAPQPDGRAAGGDGFDVIVDPDNANNWVGEYTDGTMYSTTDGGHSFADDVSPTCVGQATVGLTPRPDCDPGARFVTPVVQDQQNAEHLARRRRGRLGQHQRLEHQLHHRQRVLLDERVRHRRGQRGHRAVLGGQRQCHLRRVGRRRR